MDSVSCNGLSDGTATANGITDNWKWAFLTVLFQYMTGAMSTTNPATGLSDGNYTVTVTDKNTF